MSLGKSIQDSLKEKYLAKSKHKLQIDTATGVSSLYSAALWYNKSLQVSRTN
jgi:hypothetical protein